MYLKLLNGHPKVLFISPSLLSFASFTNPPEILQHRHSIKLKPQIKCTSSRNNGDGSTNNWGKWMPRNFFVAEKVFGAISGATSSPIAQYISSPITFLHRVDPRIKMSSICSLDDVNNLKPGKGYAVSGGGRGIERVDVSIDDGKTWVEASKYQKAGNPYISDDKWAWVFFEAEADIPESTEIVSKAVDIAGNVQPKNVEVIWNLIGILNTLWHRVHVQVDRSN